MNIGSVQWAYSANRTILKKEKVKNLKKEREGLFWWLTQIIDVNNETAPETLAVTIKKAFNTVIAPWFLSCNHLRNGFKSQSAYSMMETSTSSTNPWRNVRDNARTSLSRLGTTKGLLGLGICMYDWLLFFLYVKGRLSKPRHYQFIPIVFTNYLGAWLIRSHIQTRQEIYFFQTRHANLAFICSGHFVCFSFHSLERKWHFRKKRGEGWKEGGTKLDFDFPRFQMPGYLCYPGNFSSAPPSSASYDSHLFPAFLQAFGEPTEPPISHFILGEEGKGQGLCNDIFLVRCG